MKKYGKYQDSDGYDLPVVACFDTGHTYSFWCPFCAAYHNHSREEGHRVAHCDTKNSPFGHSGYILRLVGKAPAVVLKDKEKSHDQFRRDLFRQFPPFVYEGDA